MGKSMNKHSGSVDSEESY